MTPHPDAHTAGIEPMREGDILRVIESLNGIKGSTKDGSHSFPDRNERAESCVINESTMLQKLFSQYGANWEALAAAVPTEFGVVASKLAKHAPTTAYMFAMHVQEGTYSETGPSWVLDTQPVSR